MRGRILKAFLLLAMVASTASSTLAAPDLKNAWKFTAFAIPYGRFKGTVIFDTAAMDNGVFRFSMHGPNFESFKVYNPENKAFIETTTAAYTQQWVKAPKFPSLKKVGKGKMFNLDCVHYVGEFRRPGTTIDAWYTYAVPLDRRLWDSFSRLCGVPPGYGLPVKVRVRSTSGTMLLFEIVKLETTRVTKESMLIPKSARFMKDHALLYFTNADGSNSGIDEFFRAPLKDGQ